MKFWRMGASGLQELLGRSQEHDHFWLSIRVAHDFKKSNLIFAAKKMPEIDGFTRVMTLKTVHK